MSLISDLLSGGIKGIGDTAKGIIDSINAPKEEKDKANLAIQSEIDKHLETVGSQEADIKKAYLADVANARDDNAKIQDSAQASKLAKNTPYVIAIFIILFWGTIASYIILKALNIIREDHPVDFSAVLAIFSSVTALATMVISFFFGSSQGSEAKQKTIDNMVAKTEQK